jgi:hypothetical protein
MAELLMTPLGTVFLQPTFWESETKLSCQDCEQFKPNGYDGHCQKLGQSIYSKHKICQDFIERQPPDISPSNSRRKKGDGSGYIQLHPTKQKGKIYDQYYYHYELWEAGDRLIKSSVYIPKRLLPEIEVMDSNKEPVIKILKALGKTV